MTDKDNLGALIVTGASRGIGAAIARLAGQRGYSVAVNYCSGETEAKNVVDDIVRDGGRSLAIHADISREEEIVRMFQTAERELGPIKALVNNAGITGGFARVEEVTADAIHKTFTVNVTGAILCAREVATEGIRVNAVSPGLTDTDLHAANGEPGRIQRLMGTIPMARAGLPEEIAEGVLRLLSPAASYTTGAILAIGGGR